MNTPEHLIAAYLDDALSEAEREELSRWLKADSSNLQRFTEAVLFEQQIRAAAHVKSAERAVTDFSPSVAQMPTHANWFTWRPLAAAAAGLVIGLFSASMVFGIVVQRGAEKRTPVTVFAPGFEVAQLRPGLGFPDRAGQWSGDAAQVVAAENGMSPKEGKFMLRLEPMSKAAPRIFQVLDLQSLPPGVDGESREVEVSASFATAVADSGVRFMVRAFAVTEAPENLDSGWFERREEAIAMAAHGLEVSSGVTDWRTVSVKLQVPRAARSLVLFFGVRTPDKSARTSPHYLDDVRVSLVTPSTLQ
jgi:hypothetical protein